jgi:SAM-dependent methyltransferase
MPADSIRAYDLAERVASYDADMDLLHPNRHKMVEVVLDILAAAAPEPKLILDLGTGTGFLLDRLLCRFPACRAIGIDGAQQMVGLARSRLSGVQDRVEFRIGDFRNLIRLMDAVHGLDAVISSYALHHLDAAGKSTVYAAVRELLKPGGWFLNADLVIGEDKATEELAQRIRVQGIMRRAQGRDPRFTGEGATREFLAELERKDGDQPLTLAADFGLLKDAGFHDPKLFWKDMREVVFGARC